VKTFLALPAAAILLSGCGKAEPGIARIEIAREKDDKGEHVISCYVERERLAETGAREEQVKEFILQCSNAFGKAVVEGAFGEGDGRPLDLKVPEWAPVLFKDGIDLEIITTGADGKPQVQRQKAPFLGKPSR